MVAATPVCDCPEGFGGLHCEGKSTMQLIISDSAAFLTSLPSIHIVPPVCQKGAIRLMDGGNSLQGRVEVCYTEKLTRVNKWGTVCEDQWDQDDAEVACRQLNIPGMLK